MSESQQQRRKPAITIRQSDYIALTRLAESIADRNPAVSEELLSELDRAKVVDDARLGDGIIRMGSLLRYSTDTGENRTVTLVFPGEADIAEDRVSVLTPIGAALIGLSQGQSIDWTTRDGRVQRLTIEHVESQVEKSAM
ncbi:nucleoside diphosphate kinase regulator [Mesorhizobium sp. GR13]|uniref:nucleoside diphosphate kinase regulator n=1 Tax=Mesorhizobium sp. GR13 TaxID=2562308 RepID=UPI0010C0EB31|nr:nucleoside diphosphate kinase regulator [Mesorhizobium sp. GR13]